MTVYMCVRYFHGLGWRLIDFGCSMPIGSPFTIRHSRTQVVLGGFGIRSHEEHAVVPWTPADDYEMLFACMFRLEEEEKKTG